MAHRQRESARDRQRAEEQWARHRNVMRETTAKRFADLEKLYGGEQCAALWKYHAALWLKATMPCAAADENMATARKEMQNREWDKERLTMVLARMWQVEVLKRHCRPQGSVFDDEVGRLLSEMGQN
jgi:hypothetical protein